ncbi:MAG: phosphomannomutase/phosphoglucomutase [Patescibacteria group bacterium]|nr:phosphomannomutase/phosphoglucomutase [Patescibacteria group bacterium]
MFFKPKIFKSYDIRGIYPKEINEKTAEKVGMSFVEFLNQTNKNKNPKKLNIVVGRDNRISSKSLFKSLSKGIMDCGANVIDIGLSTSPMLYWAVAHYKFDGGVEITASHNSPQYNGFKLVRKNAVPISGSSGLELIKNIIKKNELKPYKLKGKIIHKKVFKEYLKFIFSRIDVKNIQSFKVVADTANAVSGIVAHGVLKKMNCKYYHLFSTLDNKFPNHFPNPLLKKNLRSICQKIKDKKADLGIAFDGDGDRIVFIDENGRIVSGDIITAIMAQFILRENSQQKILYDLCSSRIVKETILQNKGIPRISRKGHSFIKEKMRREDILFGGEFSGHYYYKKHYFSESPFFVLFKILEEMSKTKKKFSDLTQPLNKYFHSGEINFKIKNKKEILKKLEKKYSKGKISHLDGLKIDFKDWWFNARFSQTEPLLRLIVEAKTKKTMNLKKKELKSLICRKCRG